MDKLIDGWMDPGGWEKVGCNGGERRAGKAK